MYIFDQNVYLLLWPKYIIQYKINLRCPIREQTVILILIFSYDSLEPVHQWDWTNPSVSVSAMHRMNTVYRVSFIVTREAKGYFYNQTTEMLHVKHKRMKKVGLISIILFKT